MPVIGTAGHVDHGKSTLVQRITGRDPDRWAEEKRRGLTIDLGFAWATLPGGVEVSFVDVPGHERFMKNMLAGIEGIDVALLVVAADEGWKPQSEEHLVVLDLLSVSRGVVALTKTDLVEDDLVALAGEEIAEKLVGTSLAGAPVVPVSGVTGSGVDELLRLLATQPPHEVEDRGRPRLWVDRSFAAAGAGTVVTGTLLGGAFAVDDTVEIHPSGVEARIRGIQSHERTYDRVGPGRRVALNLSGVAHHETARGDLVAHPGRRLASRRVAVHLRRARGVAEIDRRGAYQVHVGSASRRAEILGVSGDRAVLQLSAPLPLAVGDRFILRDTGRRAVIGGGRVLDPAPARTRRALAMAGEVDPEAGADSVATSLLRIRGSDSLAQLEAHSDGGRPIGALLVSGQAIDPGHAVELTKTATRLVAEAHERHPLRPGLSLATLAANLGVELRVAEAVVEGSDAMERIGPDVALTGHATPLQAEQEAAWQEAMKRLLSDLAVPAEGDLGLEPELIHLKIRSGELVRIAPGLVYLPEQVEELRRLIGTLDGEFTVAQFRDAAGLSRKYAVPILEWADREGLTLRRGDLRRLR